MSDRTAGWKADIGKTLASTVVAIFTATCTASWAARGIIADYDKRLSLVEQRLQYDAQTNAQMLSEIRADVREMREAMRRGNQP